MNVLVIGANGQIGRQVLPLLVEAGHDVFAMVRKEEQLDDLEDEGITGVVADLEDDFRDALDDIDAVIFTAGSGGSTGGDKTLLIDLWAATRAMDFAEEAGADRFILVSSRNAGDPDAGPAAIRHYLVAKHFADEYLMSTDLSWTIVRPGRLTNEAPTGRVRTDVPPQDQQDIPRADVAAFLVAVLDSDTTSEEIYDLFSGETAVEDAV